MVILMIEEKNNINHIQDSNHYKELYNQLYHSAPIGFFTIGKDRSIKNCNDSATNLLGYSKNDLRKMNVFDLYSPTPEGIQKAKRLFEKFLNGTSIRNEEILMRKKDGTDIWVDLSVNAVKNHAGEVIHSNSMIIDISHRKKDIKEKTELSEHLSTIVDNINDLIAILNEKMKYEYVNERILKRLTGYTSKDIIGMSALKYIHPEDSKRITKEFVKGLKRGIGRSTYRFKHANGNWLWLESVGKTFKDKEGTTKALFISRDVTIIKKAERELKKTKDQLEFISKELELILDNIPGLVFYKDTENSFKWVNQYVAGLYNLSKEELRGKRIADLHDQEQANAFWQDDLEVINSKKPKLNYVEPMDIKEGRKWVSTSKIPVLNNNKEVIGIIGCSLDITELKRLQDKLKNSNKKYKNLFDNSPSGVILINLRGIIEEVNSSAEKIIGLQKEEIIGKPSLELIKIPERLFNSLKKKQEETIEKNFKNPFLIKFPTSSGKIKYINVKINKFVEGKESFLLAQLEDITAQKIYEHRLKEEKERFQTITTSALDGIIQIDDKGLITYWNKAAESIFGYSSEEVLNKDLHQLITPKRYHEAHEKGFIKFQNSGQGWAIGKTLELEGIHKDGDEVPVAISVSGVKVNDKWNSIAIVRDISERKAAEEKLKKSLETTNFILKSMPIGIILMGYDKRVKEINDEALKILGCKSEDEIIGEICHNNICPAEIGICPIQDLNKEVERFETLIIDRKGKKIPILKTVLPVEIEGEKILLEAFMDISDLKQAQKELKASEERYKRIIENINEGYFEVDLEGKFIFFNESTLKILRESQEILLGHSFREFVDDETQELIYSAFNDVFKYKKAIHNFQFSFYPPEQEKVELETSIYLRLDKNDEIVGFKGFLRDITERKQIENLRKEFNEALENQVVERTKELNMALKKQKLYLDEIVQSSEFKSKFLGTMSHELRTPLNAMIGFTDLLLEESFGTLNDEQREFINDIKESAQHQHDMIKQILDISKIESGQLTLNFKQFSVNNIVKQIQSVLKPLYRNKILKFKIKGLDKEIRIYADPLQFKQILYNLLSNAIKFTSDGQITFQIYEKYDEWEFKIRDTGIGIDRKDFDIIFEEFKRVDSPYVSSTRGTGLGLSLTKRLVNLHGGNIGFTSVLGIGTTFWFTLPKRKGPEDELLEEF